MRGLSFVGSVDRRQCYDVVVEDFFRFEESGDLDGCILVGIGCVDNVFLSAHAEVAAYGAGGGGAAVGGACHGTYNVDNVLAFENHYYNRGSHHRLHQSGEEGTVHEVGIVLAENFFIKLHHLDARYDQALALETGEYVANKAAADCGWF